MERHKDSRSRGKWKCSRGVLPSNHRRTFREVTGHFAWYLNRREMQPSGTPIMAGPTALIGGNSVRVLGAVLVMSRGLEGHTSGTGTVSSTAWREHSPGPTHTGTKALKARCKDSTWWEPSSFPGEPTLEKAGRSLGTVPLVIFSPDPLKAPALCCPPQ